MFKKVLRLILAVALIIGLGNLAVAQYPGGGGGGGMPGSPTYNPHRSYSNNGAIIGGIAGGAAAVGGLLYWRHHNPKYVLWIIGIWKIPGAITLVVPGFLRLKEWVYAGIVFELSGAVASLAACGRTADLIAPLFLLGLALASWALRPANRTLGKPLIAQH